MTKTQIKTFAIQAVQMIKARGGKANKYVIQCELGFRCDDEGFELVLAAAGRRVIRARGQGGGLYAA